MKKIVGLGACVYDTLINCDQYPIEDTKYKSNGVFVSGGGPVGNALVVMKKLGIDAVVSGLFANDDAGKYLIEDFKKYGVDVSGAKLLDGKTTFKSYIVLSEKTKTRTCVFDRGDVPDNPELLDFSVLEGASIVHLDGNYLNCANKISSIAKEKGVKVSLDAGGLYPNIETLLPKVDILIPSAEFALGITGKTDIPSAILELNARYSPEVLVVTDGRNGGYYFEDGKVYHYDSVKVDAVDTNGAGDTFHGAFLVAYCDGKSIKECCEYASVVAGYKVTHKGARTYPLSREIIDGLINA